MESSVEVQVLKGARAAVGGRDGAGDAGDHHAIDLDAPRARLRRLAVGGLVRRRGRGEMGKVGPAAFVGAHREGDTFDSQRTDRYRAAQQAGEAEMHRDPIDVNRRSAPVITNGDVTDRQVMKVVPTDAANLQTGQDL